MTMLSSAPLTPVALALPLVAAAYVRGDVAALTALFAGWRMQLDMWSSGPTSGSP